MINPYENQEKSVRGIASAEALARWAAVLFTSIGTFVYARDLAAKYLPADWSWAPWLAIGAGLLGAGIAAWLTDMMFGELLQRVTYDALAARHPNVVKWAGPSYFKNLRRTESILFGVLLVSLLAFDLYTTIIIRDPVADQARQADLIDVEAMRANLTAAKAAEIAALRGDAKAKAQDIREAEKRVEAANPALSRLKSDGNAWASQKLAKQQAKATATDQKSRAALEGAIAATVTDAPAYTAARIREAEAANAANAAKNARNREVLSGLYLIFTLIPKALAILLRILMVVSFLAYSVNFHPDLNGDGIIDYQDVQEYYTNRQAAAKERQAAAEQRRQAPPPTDPAFP